MTLKNSLEGTAVIKGTSTSCGVGIGLVNDKPSTARPDCER